MSRRFAFPGRVIFDHRPKTAGQSINQWLTRRLGKGCVTDNLVGRHREIISRYGGVSSILSGHFFFDDFETLDPRYQYVTVLRDPIDRAISWIWYLLNNVPAVDETRELCRGARMFVESGGSLGNSVFLESISNPYVNHFCQIGGSSSMSPGGRFVQARETLRQYDLVGFYERMPEFARDFAALIGGSDWPSLESTNVTHGKPDLDSLSASFRARIAVLNNLDIELYRDLQTHHMAELRQSKSSVWGNRGADWFPCEGYAPPSAAITSKDAVIGRAELREGGAIVQGTAAIFDVDILLAREVTDLVLGVQVLDSEGAWAFGTNTSLMRQPLGPTPPGSYRVQYSVVTNLACGSYTAGFGIAEERNHKVSTLAWAKTWCAFDVVPANKPAFVGYAHLPATIVVEPTNDAFPGGAVTLPRGTVSLISDVSPPLIAGQRFRVRVRVENSGERDWVGDLFRPINAAYHWIGSDGVVAVLDGQRTSFLAEGLAAGSGAEIEVEVCAPDLFGRHVLVLTLIQEMVGWFEEMGDGFEPARVAIDVVSPIVRVEVTP